MIDLTANRFRVNGADIGKELVIVGKYLNYAGNRTFLMCGKAGGRCGDDGKFGSVVEAVAAVNQILLRSKFVD